MRLSNAPGTKPSLFAVMVFAFNENYELFESCLFGPFGGRYDMVARRESAKISQPKKQRGSHSSSS